MNHRSFLAASLVYTAVMVASIYLACYGIYEQNSRWIGQANTIVGIILAISGGIGAAINMALYEYEYDINHGVLRPLGGETH